MQYEGILFKNKKFDFQKLEKYGFIQRESYFEYKTFLMEKSFDLTVKIYPEDKVETEVIDISSGAEYDLVYCKDAQGKFVGQVKYEFENVLEDIAQNCTTFSVFNSECAHRIIEYVYQKYKAEPEYLWKKFPNNAVFREKTSQKWYAAILTTARKSIGLVGEGEVEVLNLKGDTEFVKEIIDNERYFAAYHMNKKHWYSIYLESGIAQKEVFQRIDQSYNLIKK